LSQAGEEAERMEQSVLAPFLMLPLLLMVLVQALPVWSLFSS
jgi:hypothetical protein